MDPPHQDPPAPPEPNDDKDRKGWRPESTADLIVLLFACAVVFILIALTVGVIVAAARGNDAGPYFAILTNIMTSVISAVVGYMAGRGGKGPPPPPLL